jgi:hypothetical protein
MPPDGKLAPHEIEALAAWVSRGAPWPEADAPASPTLRSKFTITDEDRAHWAFQPIHDPAPPPVRDADWARTSIDRFVLARLETEGLPPSPRADKRTLLRRATFALTGLPPTPAEVEDFLADNSPDAFARVVDRLLASPHYGERWARHWLDVARYGEDQAHTFEARLYTQGFRYRDWLIRALNDDMPYDEFLRQQLAADLLGPADRSNPNLPALGFFAVGPVYYGDRKMLDQMDDRIDTITRGLLGLTVSCARCHDHKFDPISTADYYALAGVIASTEYVEVPLVTDEEAKAAKRAEAERLKRTKEKKKKNAPPPYDFVHAIREANPVDMAIHIRGNADNLGPVTPRRFLTVLTQDDPQPFRQGSGRLELANAIARPDNPLTARVIVNRVWRLHFGRGLVATPSNFGRLAEPPTHPELLDHLASKFVASGWSLKQLHREIMLSAAYQQSSRKRDDGWAVDPDNRWLWRMNRRRLEVEPWRDAILAVAGTLDESIGGPSADLADEDNRRRTLYARVSRHELNPLLRLFDVPDPNITSDGRPITTAPLQQLFVMNSEFMIAGARAFASRICSAEADGAARIQFAVQQAYGRPATDGEVQMGLEFIESATGERNASEATEPAAAEAGQAAGTLTPWEQYAQALLCTNEFMYID